MKKFTNSELKRITYSQECLKSYLKALIKNPTNPGLIFGIKREKEYLEIKSNVYGVDYMQLGILYNINTL